MQEKKKSEKSTCISPPSTTEVRAYYSGRCYQSAEGQKACIYFTCIFWGPNFSCLPSNSLLKDKIQLGVCFYEKMCILIQRLNTVFLGSSDVQNLFHYLIQW